jgi:TPR repeat protein
MAKASAAKEKMVFAETLKSARLGVLEAQYELGLMFANGVGVPKNIEQAVHWVRQAAQRGLTAAQYLLGTRYENGAGVEQSPHQALHWYSKAAEQGHIKAIVRMGKLYAEPHEPQAAELFRQAALTGSADAQYALGQAYAAGRGLEQNFELAVRWLTDAAVQGFSAAQYDLAEMYAKGQGVTQNQELALDWYQQAADQDHLGALVALELRRNLGYEETDTRTLAKRKRDEVRWVKVAEAGGADDRYHLALMYDLGLALACNPEKAQHWYFLAAQQGHAKAQYSLASLLEPSDQQLALGWYEKAAAAGDPQAQFALGCWYQELGSEENAPKSQRWFILAAQQGHTEAMLEMSRLLDSDTTSLSFEYCRRAAESGLPQAMHRLAQKYEKGQGASKNAERAFYWHHKAAQQGVPEAACAAGVMLLKGVGIAKDVPAAMQWLLKAAEAGDPLAQWSLSTVYAGGGEDIQQDLKQAFVWCERAADQGFVAALSNLGLLYALTGNKPQALNCWQKAAEHNDPEALYNLALAYVTGEGFAADHFKAFDLLIKAAHQGVIQAKSRIGLMYATGDGVPQDSVEAHKWFYLASVMGDAAAQANLDRSSALCSQAQIQEGIRRANDLKLSAQLSSPVLIDTN